MTGSQIMASFIECLYFKCTRKFTTWVTMTQNHLTLVSGDLTPLLTLKGGKNKLGGREISVAKALALQVEQSAGPQNPLMQEHVVAHLGFQPQQAETRFTEQAG